MAERAGVGIGTLYRHFHNRDALLAALYRNEVERLEAAAATLAKELSPLEALKTWLDQYAALMMVKYGFADAMKSAMKSDAEIFTHSREQTAGRALLAARCRRRCRSGPVRRPGGRHSDRGRCASVGELDGEGAQKRCERLLGLTIDGLRYGATG